MSRPALRRHLLPLPFALVVCSCSTPPSNFQRVDTDRDGRLDVSELERSLVEGLHTAGDANGDGTVTHAEWVTVYPASNGALFRRYDRDGVAGLSLAEATTCLEKEGTFRKLLSKIDTNGDRVIDPEEAAIFHEAMVAAEGGNNVQRLLAILK